MKVSRTVAMRHSGSLRLKLRCRRAAGEYCQYPVSPVSIFNYRLAPRPRERVNVHGDNVVDRICRINGILLVL